MSEENLNEAGENEEEEIIISVEELAELKAKAAEAEESAARADQAEQQLEEVNARTEAGMEPKVSPLDAGPVDGAVFLRDTFAYEVSEGEKGHKKGDKVKFLTTRQYERWQRRGACETPEHTADRLAAEKKKQEADAKAARGDN